MHVVKCCMQHANGLDAIPKEEVCQCPNLMLQTRKMFEQVAMLSRCPQRSLKVRPEMAQNEVPS